MNAKPTAETMVGIILLMAIVGSGPLDAKAGGELLEWIDQHQDISGLVESLNLSRLTEDEHVEVTREMLRSAVQAKLPPPHE